ncbi:EmrB/QacA subfamily drug resistance transporter [Actinomycetospora succinea]|uniref:EmrB/QacA subfamily drug resistance transporter n=1 Tax=Actinomycetospora succinea TaxID=663603 RepID=A0A4R6VAC4_9PSEU|nr:MFS transporter [Actinomycetospora succinea]TDQ55878.1 EmrB/QacA subfamily drug resistance transporter [Actinomycetospora succinea]
MTDTKAAARGAGSVLATSCLSTFVVNANTSAVSILLPSISADLGAPIDLLQWAVTGYLLVGAATIVTSGVLGDVFGRRLLFLSGLALFVASCALIALAPTGEMVVLGRVIQGASGAAILATGLSLLSVATDGPARMRAVTLWGAASAAGAAAGPVLGGVLNEVAGWQGLFWLDAAIAAVCIPWVMAAVPESRDPDRPRSVDLAGTVLVAAILAPLIFAVTEGSTWGWASPATLGCLAVSVLAVVGFVLVERRVTAPLIDLALLRNLLLVVSTVAILIGAGAIAGISFLISLYFQSPAAFGMSSLEAGLACLPVALVVVLAAPAVAPLAHRFGGRPVVVLGFLLLTGGFVLLTFVGAGWTYLMFLPGLLAVALGLSLSNGPASSAATESVPPAQVGAASGISNMARYVGGAVVTAIVAGLYTSVDTAQTAAGATPSDSLATAFSRACIALVVVSALGIPLARRAGRKPKPTPVQLAAAAAATTVSLPVHDAVPVAPSPAPQAGGVR